MVASRLARILRSPLEAAVAALEPLVSSPHPARMGVLVFGSLLVSWTLYVPLHELLHAAGCALAGGTVTTLEIQTRYGGALLARIFSFVEPGGDYAGRLSGFDTHGSDAVYLATDALPFVLSIAIGTPLLRWAAGRARPLAAGAGFVLGLAPFYNLPGDYFEMGAILATHPLDPRWQTLRSDDLFRLLGLLADGPARLGLGTSDGGMAGALIAVSGVLALALAYGTWLAGEAVWRTFAKLSGAPPRGSGQQEADEGE